MMHIYGQMPANQELWYESMPHNSRIDERRHDCRRCKHFGQFEIGVAERVRGNRHEQAGGPTSNSGNSSTLVCTVGVATDHSLQKLQYMV